MATQILRTVDRWRFETPLALVLGAATGFAVLAMPPEIFAHVPAAGRLGMAGHVVLALLLAIVCGGVGYCAMRRPAKIVPIDEDVDPIDELDVPSGLSEDRLLRLRRADRHPDAPPRAPIRASRDLGEPFMDVGAFTAASASGRTRADAADAEPVIVDGDYVEVDAAPESVGEASEPETVADAAPAEVHALGDPFFAPPVIEDAPVPPSGIEAAVVGADAVEAPVAERPAPTQAPASSAAPRQDTSIAAMMERLSAGMERRSGRPASAARDMRPALRDALDELNRLAARRG
jgi:hypothetical protein